MGHVSKTPGWVRAATIAAVVGCGVASEANAQATSPVNIPLTLVTPPAIQMPSGAYQPPYEFGITVGIDRDSPQTFLFDTGSSLFNARYQGAHVPPFPIFEGNGVAYQYGPSGSIGTVTGNLQVVRTLYFYKEGKDGPSLFSSLNAGGVSGYLVNSIFPKGVVAGSAKNADFSAYFDGTLYHGIFGAGNFAYWNSPSVPDLPPPGGILGQTQVTGATQGYVVAANAWTNPVSGPSSQPNGTSVQIGGQSQSVACSPCVTVGLSREMIGQFAPVGPPGTTGGKGVVSVPLSVNTFRNPYKEGAGNRGSTPFGAKFDLSLNGSDPKPAPTLLDTGASPLVSNSFNTSAYSTSPGNRDAQVKANTELSLSASGVAGSTPSTTVISVNGSSTSSTIAPASTKARASTTATVIGSTSTSASNTTYSAGFYPAAPETPCVAPNTCNRSGIWFFLQNSVMYDLDDSVLGYSPFFVTNNNGNPLTTTKDGALMVSGSNVPLGLAVSVDGPGGVTVNGGGALQLSAVTTYDGPTIINPNGQLYVSGPGSIARSSTVNMTGSAIFDISGAWSSAVNVISLTGAGKVRLGGGNLTISNGGAATFSGEITDGGLYGGTGGSVTLGGGSFTFSGTGSYTGPTVVSAGTFTLAESGTIAGDVVVQPQGTFVNNGSVSGKIVKNGGTVSSTKASGTPVQGK
ncbi:MAG: hypothetical protein ISP45_02755 [Reyranella sp.]|nr:hypothetical protein [Reyranella sp.]